MPPFRQLQDRQSKEEDAPAVRRSRRTHRRAQYSESEPLALDRPQRSAVRRRRNRSRRREIAATPQWPSCLQRYSTWRQSPHSCRNELQNVLLHPSGETITVAGKRVPLAIEGVLAAIKTVSVGRTCPSG